ncbi:hypothetical protein L6452_02780 [Arctium lappa]|uniref:Uncharacterized protein n=1 Tax=Arctium lappa TaxID=4217 RepID=A0ACB9FK11_ARCLA|nr:hypothetical protein L6452_02780 [Arctium lappa]
MVEESIFENDIGVQKEPGGEVQGDILSEKKTATGGKVPEKTENQQEDEKSMEVVVIESGKVPREAEGHPEVHSPIIPEEVLETHAFDKSKGVSSNVDQVKSNGPSKLGGPNQIFGPSSELNRVEPLQIYNSRSLEMIGGGPPGPAKDGTNENFQKGDKGKSPIDCTLELGINVQVANGSYGGGNNVSQQSDCQKSKKNMKLSRDKSLSRKMEINGIGRGKHAVGRLQDEMVDKRTGEGSQVTVRCCGATIQKSVGKGAIGCGIIWFGEGAIGVTEIRRRDNEFLASRLPRDHLSEIEGGGGGLDFAVVLWNSCCLFRCRGGS